MEFTKMHGLGNDFIILDVMSSPAPENPAALAKKLCDRHFSIGADGLVVDASNNWQFGFLISEGEVVMCRCGDICSRYSGFKGLEGYDFG